VAPSGVEAVLEDEVSARPAIDTPGVASPDSPEGK